MAGCGDCALKTSQGPVHVAVVDLVRLGQLPATSPTCWGAGALRLGRWSSQEFRATQ